MGTIKPSRDKGKEKGLVLQGKKQQQLTLTISKEHEND